MTWFSKDRDPAADARKSAERPADPARRDGDNRDAAHTTYSAHEVDQYTQLSTTPMPYDVESTHERVIVHATAAETVRADGPTPGDVLNEVLQELGRQASHRGCDAVWSIQHTMAVDAGVLYISAIGTGSRPIVDLDRPSPGSRG